MSIRSKLVLVTPEDNVTIVDSSTNAKEGHIPENYSPISLT